MRIVGIIGPHIANNSDTWFTDRDIAKKQDVSLAIAKYFKENKLVGSFVPHRYTTQLENLMNVGERYYRAFDETIYDRVCEAFVLLPRWDSSKDSVRDFERVLNQGKLVFRLESYEPDHIRGLLILLEDWASDFS